MICLLPNCCFLSETSRMLEIYRALLARGAKVSVITHGGTHEQVLIEAGVPYDVIGAGWNRARCEAFVRSIPGMGPPDQSMWSDDEIRAYVEAEAAYFREHAVRVAVTGWTLTALLSTRVAGIPLVTEHAGSSGHAAGAMAPPACAPLALQRGRGSTGSLHRWLQSRRRRARRGQGAKLPRPDARRSLVGH